MSENCQLPKLSETLPTKKESSKHHQMKIFELDENDKEMKSIMYVYLEVAFTVLCIFSTFFV